MIRLPNGFEIDEDYLSKEILYIYNKLLSYSFITLLNITYNKYHENFIFTINGIKLAFETNLTNSKVTEIYYYVVYTNDNLVIDSENMLNDFNNIDNYILESLNIVKKLLTNRITKDSDCLNAINSLLINKKR